MSNMFSFDFINKDIASRVNDAINFVKDNTEENMVKEPSHYQQGSFETIDEMIIVFGIDDTIKFCKMNAWKYRSRALFKGNTEQDMAKANRYLEMAANLEAIKNGKLSLLMGEDIDAKT